MAVTKPEPGAAAAARAEAKADAAVATPAATLPARSGFGAWMPAIAAIVLAPALTWAAVQFGLLPYLQKKIASAPITVPAEAVAVASAPVDGKPSSTNGPKDATPSYDGFQNVVVNLAGTMGTRYLKTSFLVTGSDPNIKTVFEGAKPKLHDVTLNVLSSLTLADLEEAGAKNVIREKLVLAYNQALGRRVAEQVYFQDFVIQ